MAENTTRYDTIIAGGEVLDPGAGISGRFDVGITDGRVAAIATGSGP